MSYNYRTSLDQGLYYPFLLAGFACLLSAICYAEFGTRVPKAGSAYVYTYISIGEFWAFVIGWNILLEHMIGAASVARAWSGYVDFLFGQVISNSTIAITGEMHEQLLGRYPDFLAFTVCIAYALLLGIGVKGSAMVNSILTLINLAVIVLVIVVGFYYADLSNWTSLKDGFLPKGFTGVIAGAATCFYAYVGFDSIATAGEEAKNPSVSIPLATAFSMAIVTLGYILVSSALTLVVPYYEINPNAALPEAFSHIGVHWVKYVISLGAICGMTTTLFGSLFSLPRCMYAMAVDGLLFGFLGNVNSKTQLPLANLVISGLFSAIIALLFDLEKLVEFMSIGTLLAYTIVSASVIILRYRPTFETTASKPVLTPGSEVSSATSEVTTPSEVVNLTGTLRMQYSWLSPFFGRCEPGTVVTGAVFVYTIFCCALCILLQVSTEELKEGIWWTIIMAAYFILVMGLCLLVIVAHHQSTSSLRFKVPMVPFLPALSILLYFLYGIHHSKEGDSNLSYSILMTSSEAVKEKWGSTTRTNLKEALTRKKSPQGDRATIIDEEEKTYAILVIIQYGIMGKEVDMGSSPLDEKSIYALDHKLIMTIDKNKPIKFGLVST
ncbi:hypothetical protein NQ317_018529 [Molorchus minor]|uniref:Cationic amino acid transporter 4 n=1 Tax=Molorchus minor TaxID=1323400 RepID=A0ABQ9IW94_9CUCU|nr:hypothetical protein NQ317_018529 [Molorchus minor]